MSILYRAVWSDVASARDSGTLDGLKNCVAAWAQESDEPATLSEGRSEIVVSQGRIRRVSVRSIGSGAFEVMTTDQIPGDSTEWVTTIRVVADDEGVHTPVELRMSSDDLERWISVGRPRSVHELRDDHARAPEDLRGPREPHPRVYFHDGTTGPTKKVHIGLVGPHYLVPNKSTN